MPNTLILYDGKMSSTERVAEGVGQVIGHARICEISEGPARLDDYEGVCFVFNFYGALTAGKTKVYLEERKAVLKEKRLAFLGLGFTDSGFTKYCVDMEDMIGGVTITAMFIRNERQTAEAAYQIARRMQAPLVKCDEQALMERIEAFIRRHHTLGLAVSSEGFVRMTPLNYLYVDGEFYIITEGGLKFRGLLLSESASCAIYDTSSQEAEPESLQMQAKATIMERNTEDYWRILAMKGITPEEMAAIPVNLFIIKITPQQYAFLSPTFKEVGMDVCQTLDTTFRRRRWEAGLAYKDKEVADSKKTFAVSGDLTESPAEEPEKEDNRELVMKERLARAAKEADTAMSAAILNRRESDSAASNARAEMENRIESLLSQETTAQLAAVSSMMVQEKKTLAETEEELARVASEIVREKALAPEGAFEEEVKKPAAPPDPVKEREDREKLAALIAKARESEAKPEDEDDDKDIAVDAFFEPADAAGSPAAAGENESPAKAEDMTEPAGLEIAEASEGEAADQTLREEASLEAGDGEAEEAPEEPFVPVLAKSELKISQDNFKMPTFLKTFVEDPEEEAPAAGEGALPDAAGEPPAAEAERPAAGEGALPDTAGEPPAAEAERPAAGEGALPDTAGEPTAAGAERPAAGEGALPDTAGEPTAAEAERPAAGEGALPDTAGEPPVAEAERPAAGEGALPDTAGELPVAEAERPAAGEGALPDTAGEPPVAEAERPAAEGGLVKPTVDREKGDYAADDEADRNLEHLSSEGVDAAARDVALVGAEAPDTAGDGAKAPGLNGLDVDADGANIYEASTYDAEAYDADTYGAEDSEAAAYGAETPDSDIYDADAFDSDEFDAEDAALEEAQADEVDLEEAESDVSDEGDFDEDASDEGGFDEDASDEEGSEDDASNEEGTASDEYVDVEDAPFYSGQDSDGKKQNKKTSFFDSLLKGSKAFLKILTLPDDDEDDDYDDDEDDEDLFKSLSKETDASEEASGSSLETEADDTSEGALDEAAGEAFVEEEEPDDFDEAKMDRPAAEQDRRKEAFGGFFKMGGFFQNYLKAGDDDADYFDLDSDDGDDEEIFGVDQEEEEKHEAEVFAVDEKEEKKSVFSGFRKRLKEEETYDPDFEAIMEAEDTLLPEKGSGRTGFFGKTLGRMSRFLGFDESQNDDDDGDYDDDDELYEEEDDD